ncbi:MAG: efflux RND transporter permease subunit [Bdellovibrionales bacterium]|nr:efflux RND transporter permease subunit [Bdellovibrionales bacterium]
MSLSKISIERPVFAWILMFGLIFFGLLSFTKMGINENPDVDFPTIRVQYSYEGATPAVIEKDVIEPVESVLVSMEGIRNLSSTANRGSANIQLEFELDRNIDFALQEVQTLLGRAQRLIPETIEPPTVTKSNAADDPLMYLNIKTETLSDRELMVLFRDQVRDRLSTVEGVAEIRAFGYHEPMLRVDLIAKKLQEYQLTANDIVSSILREHKELPAGRLEFKDTEETIRIMGEITKPEKFKDLIISRRGGSPNFIPIRLKDVAHIYEGIENLKRISRLNGIKALGMAVQKQRGVNAASTADLVIKRIEEVNKDLPKGTELGVNFDRTQFIRESVDELTFTLILSALLTSLVCWLFLGSWSATFNILLAIPTAIIGTFIFIRWLGFTLNTFSLLGLALAIGVVVDDAIIMLENIVRYMQLKWDRVNASFKGSREITFAVIATTAALVSIFVPISFLPGLEGKFFFEFAVTISIAVMLSSLEALTLAPMRCSQFLKLEERTSRFGKAFEAFILYLTTSYQRILTWSLGHSKMILSLSVFAFGLALIPLKYLSTEFAPSQDRSVLFLIFIAPDGKSLEYTTNKVKEFEELIKTQEGVERQFLAVGGFGQGGQGNRGNGVVILKNPNERKLSQFEVADQMREKAKSLKGIQVFIRDRFGSPFGGRRGSPLEFTINGPDPEKQKELFFTMKSKMEESGLMVGVRSDDTLTLPEVHIIPNREKALKRGVEVSEIADIVNTTFGGVAPAQYTDGSRRFDIFVQLQKEDREQKKDLENILVRNNRGELLPLSEVVDVVSTEGPQQIFREDRVRGLRVDSNLAKGAVQGDAIRKVKTMAKELLPEGYYLKFEETPDDKLLDIIIIMLLGLVIAYMVLATQFNSFIDPWIVFLAIPFGLIGSIFSLIIGNQSLNIYSVIGMLLTMGIVKKNSILLVEFINQLRDQGKSIKESILEACPIRLRPILMTTTATLAAAIPPALALGPGSETRVPMALTVLGGVSLSGIVTLLIVPCAYYVINPTRRPKPIESPLSTPPESVV